MNTILSFITIFLVLISCANNSIYGQKTKVIENRDSLEILDYDAALAKKYGADEYGMRKYVMAYLKSGPNRSHDSTTAAQLLRAHLDNINRMANEGKLVLAGPFLDNGEVRGIYIFAVETIEEAEALTNSDPAIKAGRLVMELHPWYGSAALIEINNLHKKISKYNP